MVEAKATRKDDAATVAKFLFELIITRYGCPLELVSDRGTHFLNKEVLFKKMADKRLCRCLEESEVPRVVNAMHTKDVGGHYATRNTVTKIVNVGYWWPTMFKDVLEYIRRCDSCQRTGRPTPTTRWPLTPIMPLAPFKKWGTNFVGPIQPVTRNTRRRYNLVATDYATKMVEAEATRRDDAATVATFLFESIITRYGCPLKLVSDRGIHFLNKVIENLTQHF
ncbi:hypothetical protein AXG93_2085s1050 [Marchantia polymorpha subsp. ruderalis]|uniref:Integrase catalytic domain-containing protein n=1 Tax=Marchantia polymorpha subsp. ruderalis TaxID=1480154 RepID=A0A176VKW3_MARPO|nr:hypothetical protein AXG93_2085s1050 [Marchantia polymorpha subsp. ruderalis]